MTEVVFLYNFSILKLTEKLKKLIEKFIKLNTAKNNSWKFPARLTTLYRAYKVTWNYWNFLELRKLVYIYTIWANYQYNISTCCFLIISSSLYYAVYTSASCTKLISTLRLVTELTHFTCTFTSDIQAFSSTTDVHTHTYIQI